MNPFSRIIHYLWLLFFLIILVLFFQWNEPLRRVGVNLLPLIHALFLLFCTAGLGWPVSRLLTRSGDPWIRVVTAVAFGLGLNALLTLLLGIVGYFHPLLFFGWFIAGFILFLIALYQEHSIRRGSSKQNEWFILGFSILLLFLGAALPLVVAPDASKDTMEYHLLIPKLYLQLGGIERLPLLVEASYPSLAEYNYLPILLLTDVEVCKCFHFWIAMLLLILLGRVVKRIAPDVSPVPAAAFFLAMPVTAIHMAWAWNDFMYNLFILLSVYSLLEYHLEQQRSGTHLFTAGLFLGLASWTKYTFVLQFIATALLLFIAHRKWRWDWRKYWLLFAGFGLLAPLWAVQNWVLTGNPVYPFLHSVFQSPYWTNEADRFFHTALRNYEILEWNWTSYIFFPLQLTFQSRIIEAQPGILPLALLPLLFVRATLPGLSFLKVLLGCSVVAWLIIHTENRSIFSVFALLFCITSVTLQQIRWPGKNWKYLFSAFVLAAAVSQLYLSFVTMYYLFDPIRYFVGRESKAQYLRRVDPSIAAYEWLNAQSEVGHVLLVSMQGPLYLNRPSLFSSFADPPVAQMLSERATSPKDLAARLRKLEVSHVVIDRNKYDEEQRIGPYYWSAEVRNRFQHFVNEECRPVIRFDDIVILELKEPR